jgi:methylglutaconyl-CoA hydratase
MLSAHTVCIAANTAKLGLTETRLAIIPGAGGTQRLPRTVGMARAKELIFTARIIDGSEAARIGLVNEAVEQNANGTAAYERACHVAREIVKNVSNAAHPSYKCLSGSNRCAHGQISYQHGQPMRLGDGVDY